MACLSHLCENNSEIMNVKVSEVLGKYGEIFTEYGKMSLSNLASRGSKFYEEFYERTKSLLEDMQQSTPFLKKHINNLGKIKENIEKYLAR